MTDNVIQIKKAEPRPERFGVFVGKLNPTGELEQKERIGSAYTKRDSKKFRIKLWLMGNVSYFLTPSDKDPRRYYVLIPESYRLPTSQMRTNWHRVGMGEVAGTYIKIRIYLFAEDIYLSMFPDSFRNFTAKEPSKKLFAPNVA